MHTIEITGRDEVYEVPSDWDELSNAQVVAILKNAVLFSSGQMNYQKFVIQSFYTIAGVKRNWLSVVRERLLSKTLRDEKYINTLITAEHLTKFLFKPVSKKDRHKPFEFNFNTVINVFPSFKAQGINFYGPQDMLGDLTFGEFISAIEAMNEYFSSKIESDLDRFIVTLYRPSDIGSKRLTSNEDDLDEYANRLKKLAPHIKMGIILWFTSCINHLKSSDITIAGKELNLSVLFPAGKKNENQKVTGIGWLGVLYGVAKEGLFGPIEETNKANLYKVLLFMYDAHLTNQRLIAKQKQK